MYKAILDFRGGYGNQMFQYALYRKLMYLGYEVSGNVIGYKDSNYRTYGLEKIFGIKIKETTGEEIELYREKYALRSLPHKIFDKVFPEFKKIYRERNLYHFDSKVFKIRDAVLMGYWQSYKYFDDIKELLLKEFCFPKLIAPELVKLEKMILAGNTVGIHVRGGDYLTDEGYRVYGQFCNAEYYARALEYITSRLSNTFFVGFTNDIEYAKKAIPTNVYWVSEAGIENYQDWVDMYLMSICKHNIIANSSFSFWGAYLNNNPDKIVVAPAVWHIDAKYDSVCPPNWIRL